MLPHPWSPLVEGVIRDRRGFPVRSLFNVFPKRRNLAWTLKGRGGFFGCHLQKEGRQAPPSYVVVILVFASTTLKNTLGDQKGVWAPSCVLLCPPVSSCVFLRSQPKLYAQLFPLTVLLVNTFSPIPRFLADVISFASHHGRQLLVTGAPSVAEGLLFPLISIAPCPPSFPVPHTHAFLGCLFQSLTNPKHDPPTSSESFPLAHTCATLLCGGGLSLCTPG